MEELTFLDLFLAALRLVQWPRGVPPVLLVHLLHMTSFHHLQKACVFRETHPRFSKNSPLRRHSRLKVPQCEVGSLSCSEGIHSSGECCARILLLSEYRFVAAFGSFVLNEKLEPLSIPNPLHILE